MFPKSSRVFFSLFVLTALGLASMLAAQERTSRIKPLDSTRAIAPAPITVLTYNRLKPVVMEQTLDGKDPDRTLVDTSVGDDDTFFAALNGLPDTVALIADEAFIAENDKMFEDLTANNEMNIMASMYGKIADLEAFAMDQFGINDFAGKYVSDGETSGMLMVQYVLDVKIAYLFGESAYGLDNSSIPEDYQPITGRVKPRQRADRGGPAFLYHLVRLIHAALEEPFWNKVHYTSGYYLGCLGVSWDNAFEILFEWEIFEIKLGISELGQASGVYGIIWDLIWGMTGYIDGATGWEGILPD